MKIKKDLARITIDLPIELQKKLKAVCAMNTLSMREVVVKSIEKQLKKMTPVVDDMEL